MNTLSPDTVFSIQNPIDFEKVVLETYRFQYDHNEVYQRFCNHIKKSPDQVHVLSEIPFLPISFFKSHRVATFKDAPELSFSSSGTTGSTTSKHHIKELSWYEHSFMKAFELSYGPVEKWCILALLPSYLERTGSSLVYMADSLIKKTGHPDSGFYLNNLGELYQKLQSLQQQGTQTLLIGVSFALLDFVEKHPLKLKHTVIMETGGMKGRRKELIREDLHDILKKGFGVGEIHSEYGMTELLSQAYSQGEGRFSTPPWMRVYTRDTEDPLQLLGNNKTGGLNIIDLANRHSCSFIATQDLGKVYENGSFEVLGRFDHSDVRGCNLMVL